MNSAIFLVAVLSTGVLPSWDFDNANALDQWQPNAQLADVSLADGIVHARANGWDPFFSCQGIEIETNPWQYVLIRIKADQSGEASLFWSGETTGPYGGLTEKKKCDFRIRGDGQWRDIAVFPFWHTEGKIRQMRLDVYDAATFDIDAIRVLDWGVNTAPLTDTCSWRFPDGDLAPWRVSEDAPEYFAPPLDLSPGARGFVVVRMRATHDAAGRVLWATPDRAGVQSESFSIRGDGQMREYNVEVAGYPSWSGRIIALGLDIPKGCGAQVESVTLSETPLGPPDMLVSYFGFENGANRAGRPSRVLVQMKNSGGAPVAPFRVQVTPGEGLQVVSVLPEEVRGPEFGETADWTFEVIATAAGAHPIQLILSNEQIGVLRSEAQLNFLPALGLAGADYVPVPRPVSTVTAVLAYYFPGWATDTAWDCIRSVAPIRKPLLGYYDEANPECVDWQIKWAVENGIKGFLVDWYWNLGNQHLRHWFDAYRNARYRDMLEVAIMWANHNPPGSHNRDDWRAVTREWIDTYFNLPAYYRIDGKPAVFLWDPSLIRTDLGGSQAVKEAFGESQAMAREAGYDGIVFVSVNRCDSPSDVKALLEEGYHGATNYHEWGRAVEMAPDKSRARYEDVAATAPAHWRERDEMCGALAYYPLVDTGWDSRPWHGSKSLVLGGRNAGLFDRLLDDARRYCEETNKPFLVLGPLNEWGEGSYIEPATEYGFEMYETIRRVFATGEPSSWPVNFGPADVGLGPYDFPPSLPTTSWEFESDAGGWSAMMGVGELAVRDGTLHFRTMSGDPALQITTRGLNAKNHPKITIRMRLDGLAGEPSTAQLFWSSGDAATSEAASVTFPIEEDGAMHTYTLDLAANPRWRGRITRLRFDPGSKQDLDVAIDRFAFEP